LNNLTERQMPPKSNPKLPWRKRRQLKRRLSAARVVAESLGKMAAEAFNNLNRSNNLLRDL
jgi:hypothetical protein